jgi:hypothetical protein
MSKTQLKTSSSSTLGTIPQYTQVPETTHELDWADLATLDLSKFSEAGGKEELAKQLHNAIEQIGLATLGTFDSALRFCRVLLCNQLWP